MIVFAAIAPHGGPVFDQPEGPTRQGMEELGRRFAAARPEAVIVADAARHARRRPFRASSARSRLAGRRVPVDATPTRAVRGPRRSRARRRCVAALQEDGLPALGITFGTTAAGASTMPLDWGALIPLWFMRVRPSSSPRAARSRTTTTSAPAQRSQRATGEPPVAFVASADHGHGHTQTGRTASRPSRRRTTTRIQELVRGNRARRARRRGTRQRARRCECGQLLAAADASRRARRRLRRRAPLLRGADLLRDADRRPSAGRTETGASAKCPAWRARSGPTRRPRRRRAASRSAARAQEAQRRARARAPPSRADRARPRRRRRLPRGGALVRLQRRTGRRISSRARVGDRGLPRAARARPARRA